jgi:hypothetical protein
MRYIRRTRSDGECRSVIVMMDHNNFPADHLADPARADLARSYGARMSCPPLVKKGRAFMQAWVACIPPHAWGSGDERFGKAVM